MSTDMSTDLPAAFVNDAAPTSDEVRAASGAWAETALTVLFAATTVLFVSILAVITVLG